jgi:prepilin peptidase CpaA
MPGQLPEAILGLALLTLLGQAAWTDIRERRIANATCLAIVALWPVFLAVTSGPVRPTAALQLALAVFAVGAILWSRGWLGGGDVKLLAATALWAGPSHILAFLLTTTLAGGALSLLILWHARGGFALLLPLQAAAARLGLPFAAAIAPGASSTPATLPYAVPIAFGGGLTALRLIAG